MGFLIVFLLLIYVIALFVMALLQMIGGRLVAKLKNATYGSAFLICLFSTLGTSVILFLLAKMSLINNVGVGIVFSILLSTAILLYATKLKWKCSNYISAIKASSINIIVTVIFWIVFLSKLSEFF